MVKPMRVVFGGLVFVAVVTALAVLVAAGVGLIAWAAYLALRAGHSAPWAAGWVGAGMLALAGLGLALARAAGRRGSAATPPASGTRGAGTPASLAWLEREPVAAAVLAVGLGFGAARSRRVRRVVEDILRDWPQGPRQ